MDEGVNVAIHDGLEVGAFGAGAKVLDHLIGLEDVAADLIAPADFAFFAIELFHLRAFFVHDFLIQLRFEDLHGCGLVFVLGALILTGHYDVGREVGDAHG